MADAIQIVSFWFASTPPPSPPTPMAWLPITHKLAEMFLIGSKSTSRCRQISLRRVNPTPNPSPRVRGAVASTAFFLPQIQRYSVIYGVRRASHPPWGGVGGGVDKGGAICSIKNYNSSLMYHHKIIQLVGNREHLGEGMGA